MSDNIFAEIYNKILGLFGQNVKDESKNTAVNRLRLVLMQDRTNLTPEIMNRMRTELIEVLSKYVELDQDALDLNIGQEGEQMALMLSIPVIRAKDEAEIEAALKKEEEDKKAQETGDENEQDEESESDSKENENEQNSSDEENVNTEADVPDDIDNTTVESNKEESEITEAPFSKTEDKKIIKTIKKESKEEEE